MKIGSDEYKAGLKAYRKAKGGVPMDQGMIAAQGWSIAREREYQDKLKAEGIVLEPAENKEK